MAQTTFTTTNSVLIRSALMSGKAYLWAQDNMFFQPFIGKQNAMNDTRTAGNKDGVAMNRASNSIITMKDKKDLGKGATVDLYIRAPLIGAGKVDSQTLINNEEKLTFYDQSLTVHKRRHAVSVDDYKNFISEFSPEAFDEMAKEALGEWIAQAADTDILLALSGLANSVGTITANAPTRIFYGGQTTAGVVESVAADANIDSNTDNMFGTKVIEAVKRKAQTGAAAYPKVRPIIHKGKKYYVMFVHPLAMKALKAETAWINANKDGLPRGLDNPIFTGAEGVWDGVIIHEWEKIETRLGAGGSTATEYFESGDNCNTGDMVARNLFCGSQSGLFTIGRNLHWEEEMTDYQQVKGVAIDAYWQAAKTQFNSNDYGVIAVDTIVNTD